ncbi:MAG: hypothetical protein HY900_10305 [Deltaproteobacteria bacterium]|nr:hypothetical protein [Deltaproteobacteria bacterium]
MRALLRRKAAFLIAFLPLCLVSLAGPSLLPVGYRSEAMLRADVSQANPGGDPQAWAAGWLERTASAVLRPEVLRTIAERNRVSAKAVAEARALRSRVERCEAGEGPARSASVTFSLAYTAARPTAAWGVAKAASELFLLRPTPPPAPRAAQDPREELRRELRGVEAELRKADDELAADRNRERQAADEWKRLLPVVEASTREAAEREASLRALREKRAALEGNLAALPASIPGPEPHPEASETDPTDREDAPKRAESRVRLKDLQAKLASLRRILGPGDPQVLELSKQVDGIEAELREKSVLRRDRTPPPPRMIPNPARATVQEEIALLDREIARAGVERSNAATTLAGQKARLAAASVKHDSGDLARKREALQRRNVELALRVAQPPAPPEPAAEPSVTFTLVRPAELPESPLGTDRRALGLAGLLSSLIAGVLAVAVRERLDPILKAPHRATELTGLQVLAVLPPTPDTDGPATAG